MECFILAGGENQQKRYLKKVGEITQLEKSYRRFAAVFDRVKLVIKKEQAKEHFLNYPYVCDKQDVKEPVIGVETALQNASSDAVFIGSADISDFPLKLLMELINNYNGESFMGYYASEPGQSDYQSCFGIYNKKLLTKLNQPEISFNTLKELLADDIKLIRLPENYDAACIGIK